MRKSGVFFQPEKLCSSIYASNEFVMSPHFFIRLILRKVYKNILLRGRR